MKEKSLPERAYMIKYKIYNACGGSFKYALNPQYKEEREYFSREERDNFIKRFLNLTSTEKEIYIDDVEVYFSELKKVNSEQMNKIIDQV